MDFRWFKIFSIAAGIPLLLFGAVMRAEAVTKVSGNYFLEETWASGPQGGTELIAGGINFNIEPQTAKRLHFRFNVPLTFEISESGRTRKAAPVGNLAADFGGDWFTFNLQYGRYAAISSAAQLTESVYSRAAFSLAVPDLPRLSVNYSKTETTVGSIASEINSFSAFGDYRFKGMNFRAGHFATVTDPGVSAPFRFTTMLLGMGGSYEVLPATVLSFDDDFIRTATRRSDDGGTSSGTNTFKTTAGSRPFEWLGLGAGFFRAASRYESASSTQQTVDLSAGLSPSRTLTFSFNAGNRSFVDAGVRRSVDYRTIGAAFSDRVIETIVLGLNASRSYNSDPSQGREINDMYGVNALMDVMPGVTAVASMGVSRSENREFVSARKYDAYGTLNERALYDDRPAGFTFFDTVNNDLYIKNSPAIGDWSLPFHVDPIAKNYGISKNVQINMLPTNTTAVSFSYSSSFSSDTLDLTGTGGWNARGSLTYAPNPRANCSIYRTVSISGNGNRANSTSASLSYRFLRGHQMNVAYSRQESGGGSVETLSGTLNLVMGRRTGMTILYAATQPGKENETMFLKIGISQSF